MNESVGSPCVDGVKLKWLVFERLVFHAKEIGGCIKYFPSFSKWKGASNYIMAVSVSFDCWHSYVTWLRSHMEIIRSVCFIIISQFHLSQDFRRKQHQTNLPLKCKAQITAYRFEEACWQNNSILKHCLWLNNDWLIFDVLAFIWYIFGIDRPPPWWRE